MRVGGALPFPKKFWVRTSREQLKPPVCNKQVFEEGDFIVEEFFHLEDVGKDFPPVFDRFFSSLAHRTCSRCGAVMPVPGQ
jgi:hypothetical protein